MARRPKTNRGTIEGPQSLTIRFNRILARARRGERLAGALREGVRAGIPLAAATFVALLLRGLGVVAFAGEVPLVAACLGCLAVAIGALRPLSARRALARLDRVHGLGGALLSAAWMLEAREGALSALERAHVEQAVQRAERLSLSPFALAELAVPARVFGVLCLCVLSVALA